MSKTPTPNTIRKAYIRTYSDSGQTKAYVEWSDGSRTEGDAWPLGQFVMTGVHMSELLARAKREGVKVERERW